MKRFRTFEPYILLVIAPPLAAVIGGLITLWIASNHPDGMVVDDYYRYGLAINNRIVEDEQASRLNLHATLRMTPASCGATATPCLKLKLDGNLAPLPNELTITFWHATQSGIDQTLLFKPYHGSTLSSAADAYLGFRQVACGFARQRLASDRFFG